jgi:putative spermidine/putrescine transport system ATP-binding protein
VLLAAGGLPAIVISTSFLGAQRRTVAQLESGAALVVQHAASAHPRPGDLVHIGFSGQPIAIAPRA